MLVDIFCSNADYTDVVLVNEERVFFEQLKERYLINNLSIESVWKPLAVKRGVPKKDTDIIELLPYIENMVVTKRVKNIMEKVVGDNIAFLPLINPDEEYYLVNILNYAFMYYI